MQQGFYKNDNGQLLYGPNIVEGNGYVLVKENHDQYQYPIDGWYWFETEEEAKQNLLLKN